MTDETKPADETKSETTMLPPTSPPAKKKGKDSKPPAKVPAAKKKEFWKPAPLM